jgi:hypothetical protein
MGRHAKEHGLHFPSDWTRSERSVKECRAEDRRAEGGTSNETSARCRHGCNDHARRGERGQADHTHVLILPNGKCAILAADGNEKYLILPSVIFSNNPNVDADDAVGGLDSLPLNRRHPLHVLVHLGVPGADGDIAVMGSAQDPCATRGDYVNG